MRSLREGSLGMADLFKSYRGPATVGPIITGLYQAS
jgi:hypothetical protein